ncbi:MAG: ribbon-helix-helix protein, CopG family [Actinomycetota bacterium]
MKPTMLQMTEEMVKNLDVRAAKRGISRSALVRQIIQESLRQDEERLKAARIVEGYTKIPPATPDEWGDLVALGDANTSELLKRLDEEERRQGHGPW